MAHLLIIDDEIRYKNGIIVGNQMAGKTKNMIAIHFYKTVVQGWTPIHIVVKSGDIVVDCRRRVRFPGLQRPLPVLKVWIWAGGNSLSLRRLS